MIIQYLVAVAIIVFVGHVGTLVQRTPAPPEIILRQLSYMDGPILAGDQLSFPTMTVELIRRLDRGLMGEFTVLVAARDVKTGNPYTVKFHTNATRFTRELAILSFFNNTKITTIPNVFAHDPRAQLFIQAPIGRDVVPMSRIEWRSLPEAQVGNVLGQIIHTLTALHITGNVFGPGLVWDSFLVDSVSSRVTTADLGGMLRNNEMPPKTRFTAEQHAFSSVREQLGKPITPLADLERFMFLAIHHIYTPLPWERRDYHDYDAIQSKMTRMSISKKKMDFSHNFGFWKRNPKIHPGIRALANFIARNRHRIIPSIEEYKTVRDWFGKHIPPFRDIHTIFEEDID